MDRKQLLNDVLDSNRWEAFEIIGNLRVAISRCIISNYKVWIWGFGERTLAFIKTLEKEGITVNGIIDSDSNKNGKLIKSVKIISPEAFFSYERNDATFIFFWTSCFEGNSQEKMVNAIFNNGISHWYKITSEDKNQICYFSNHDHELYYLDNRDTLGQIVDNLYDDKSVIDFVEYLRTYIENSTWKLDECDTANKYFYGGSIRNKENLYTHLEDEVWLNCGCHVGDTIFCFFKNGLKAKKIFAVDGDKRHISMIQDNISYLPIEAQNVIDVKNILIDSNTDLHSLFGNERITLINADIEGAELKLVKDMKELILLHRPVLSLCLYHKVSDAVKIPQYLMETLNDYFFVVRKYPSYYAYTYRNFELVLYAIPKERIAL
ncbi:MAG: hypothetical protein K5662_07615 [Lachnospiraceae bacterium]|nr:hypothetical protein [Lachnospiraceae bacterium]